MRPSDRRDAIISATVAVMLRKGMGATTVRDVAQEMGTSSGLIHHYFESMDSLLAAAFEHAAREDLEATVQAMADGDGPLERLKLFFSTYARADQDWAFQLWLDAWAEAGRRPEVQATSRLMNVAWQQLLVSTIGDGIAAGEMACTDPSGSAWRILSLLDGLALQAVAHRVDIDRMSVISWSVSLAEHELGLSAGALAA
jgi:AcrR family transcriptional regulator